LRRSYPEITAIGARVVAIGTGDAAYASAFVTAEEIPYLVLVDEEGRAAEAAQVKTTPVRRLARPSTLRATASQFRAGHRQGRTGSRPLQLGATFVVAPGGQLLYEHYDDRVDAAAPMADVVGALHTWRG